jgi:hypothetical protein
VTTGDLLLYSPWLTQVSAGVGDRQREREFGGKRMREMLPNLRESAWRCGWRRSCRGVAVSRESVSRILKPGQLTSVAAAAPGKNGR